MASRQEVLNVLLAQLLQKRGLVAAPEEILRQPSKSVKLPDVIVDFQGLRLVIEAEFSQPGGSKASHVKAYQKAVQRVEQGIAHIGVAVVYPNELKRTAFDSLVPELETARLGFAIVTEASVPEGQRQLRVFEADERQQEFNAGNVNDLADALRRCYEQLGQDETVGRAVALLQADIENFLNALSIQPAATARLAALIGASGPNEESSTLTAAQQLAVKRIAALIVLNALIFQEVLSQKNSDVKTLHAIRHSTEVAAELVDHWTYIITEINYVPIFSTACQLLEGLSADASLNAALQGFVQTAQRIVGWRASLRHDLAGRIYHRLLEESKFLGAYYTSIPSAVLLLKLAVRRDGVDVNWQDLESIRALRVGDLACGTGTLGACQQV